MYIYIYINIYIYIYWNSRRTIYIYIYMCMYLYLYTILYSYNYPLKKTDIFRTFRQAFRINFRRAFRTDFLQAFRKNCQKASRKKLSRKLARQEPHLRAAAPLLHDEKWCDTSNTICAETWPIRHNENQRTNKRNKRIMCENSLNMFRAQHLKNSRFWNCPK